MHYGVNSPDILNYIQPIAFLPYVKLNKINDINKKNLDNYI